MLAEHGVRFPRGWLRLNNHFELPLTLMRLDRMMTGRLRGDEWRDLNWRRDVLLQVIADLETHRDWLTILSAEDLCLLRFDDEVDALRRVVGDAEVLAYVRNPDAFLQSMAAHYLKDGMPGLSDDKDAYNYLSPGTWRAEYGVAFALWRRHFNRLAVVHYDSVVRRDRSVIPSFLRLIGVPVTDDVGEYSLNKRNDPIPRAEGNRVATGLRFGETGS